MYSTREIMLIPEILQGFNPGICKRYTGDAVALKVVDANSKERWVKAKITDVNIFASRNCYEVSASGLGRFWTNPDRVRDRRRPELKKHSKPADEIIVIKRFKNHTELVRRLNGEVTTAEIHKNRNDSHDMHKTCIYGLDKLFNDGLRVEIDDKKYWSGKAVVVRNNYNHPEYPVGTVLTGTRGHAFNHYSGNAVNAIGNRFTSLEDLQNVLPIGVDIVEAIL